ncbi:glycosyltransferase family 2 protein [Ligilactobacillus sp. Marseille-Q7487]|uniref:glycosyltransferase family 2 protein n=1 Tax=Ligilactobacillus sp. Marseille-Q7487 TaxID=3022128 RepID=UPI0024A8E532|nr:glycosyltransferase family 2 protein [Ligilactobacillus sp. Marseille-Q7487]
MYIRSLIRAGEARMNFIIKKHEKCGDVKEREKINSRYELFGLFGLLKLLFCSKSNSYKYNLAIVAIMKNEAPYIAEWINYYRSVGVKHFYIYDNESTDNLESVIQGLTDVTYQKIHGKARQLDAYNDALNRYGKSCKYMAFLDGGEFIFCPNSDNKLVPVLDAYFSKKNIGGLGINWQVFGSSNFDTKQEGLITDNYVYRSDENFEKNRHIKTVCMPSRSAGFVYDPHSMIYLPGYHAINENFERIEGPLTEVPSTKKIRINHYFSKSKEEFLSKRARGQADSDKIRDMKQFDDHDKNDIYDDSLRKYNRCHGLSM